LALAACTRRCGGGASEGRDPKATGGGTIDFESEYQRLVAALKNHPRVRIDVAQKGPPAAPADVERVRRRAGGRLPAGLEALLAWSNGCKLRWSAHEPATGAWHVGGNFDFLSVDAILHSRDDILERPLDAYGLQLPEMAKAGVITFDYSHINFLDDFTAAALLPMHDFDVMVSEDFGNFGSSYLCSFEEYMGLVFRTFASPWARHALQGRRPNASLHARDDWPKLFGHAHDLDDIVAYACQPYPTIEDNWAYFRAPA
jgi:hypothetical protein